jgi:hypothetical protein
LLRLPRSSSIRPSAGLIYTIDNGDILVLAVGICIGGRITGATA